MIMRKNWLEPKPDKVDFYPEREVKVFQKLISTSKISIKILGIHLANFTSNHSSTIKELADRGVNFTFLIYDPSQSLTLDQLHHLTTTINRHNILSSLRNLIQIKSELALPNAVFNIRTYVLPIIHGMMIFDNAKMVVEPLLYDTEAAKRPCLMLTKNHVLFKKYMNSFNYALSNSVLYDPEKL